MAKDDYEVEKILDSRGSGNRKEYLVQWKPTWETVANMDNCAKLIKEFNASRGEEDDDELNGEVDDGAGDSGRGARRGRASAAGKRKSTGRSAPAKKAKPAARKGRPRKARK